MNSTVTILFLGDVVGKAGRRVVTRFLSAREHDADLVIVNVENAAHGFGVQEQHIEELKAAGVDAFTGGNHTFDRREVFDFIDRQDTVLRPANYPPGTPGRGWQLFDAAGAKVAVVSLLGRVFMEPLQSPFLVADQVLDEIGDQTKLIFLDFHAEATAEKAALGTYLDGRVSAVIGTHTHVQTADERVLPRGTAFLTDAGCCATINSIIGMQYDAVYRRLVQQLPARFEVADGPAQALGVLVEVDRHTGRAIGIRRVSYSEMDNM